MSNKQISALMRYRQSLALVAIAIGIGLRIVQHYFGGRWEDEAQRWGGLASVLLILGGIAFVIPYKFIQRNYFFETGEYKANTQRDELVKRLRLRALLLHNYSAAVLIVTVLVILGGLLLFTALFEQVQTEGSTELIVRAASIVLLMFLVQVLFRVFKYLLRIGSYYHGIADVLELYKITAYEEAAAKSEDGKVPDGYSPPPPASVDMDKLFERMVPSAYDLSDVEPTSLLGTLKDLVKK